ncbi:MAG: hypothetical protein JW716_01480 [Candidatus Aenigmarchaeota archaeon]|nr:hypothetical protein [Candidatus Aenigmarchaeota archaeon]
MLNEKETILLRIIGEDMLIRQDEIKKRFSGNSMDYNMIIAKLVSEGYINNLDAIGSRCFAITQKGIRAIED